MRFLILNTDYPEFLIWLYARNHELKNQPYERQMQVRNKSLFGVANFYSYNLHRLGHEAYDIHANNGFMQRRWLQENNRNSKIRQKALKAPFVYLKSLLHTIIGPVNYSALSAQIRYYKPDVLINQAMLDIKSSFLKEMKQYIRLLVGQHAAFPIPDSADLSCYDMVVSSFLPTIEYFRQKGISAELNLLGFEPEVLSSLKGETKIFNLTFVGSFQRVHSSRVKLIEAVCSRFPETKVWGNGVSDLYPASPIRRCYMGEAWGLDMYRVLAKSKITLNHHGDIPPYANNCRLYEASGVGTLLVTDWKENLGNMFEIGKEVAAYRTAEECLDIIQYYLEHDNEREAVARAGQMRTLKEHNYYRRMYELVDIIKKRL